MKKKEEEYRHLKEDFDDKNINLNNSESVSNIWKYFFLISNLYIVSCLRVHANFNFTHHSI